MGNIFSTLALGALLFVSPQTEPGLPEQISLRETDVQNISVQAELNSTHLSYRNEPYRVEPIQKEIKEKPVIEKPKVQPTYYPEPAPAELYSMVSQYAAKYGARVDIMLPIMQCESGFNPSAVNGSFGGLFQFLSSTWISNRNAMGENPDPSLRFNAEESIKTAAFKMGRDGYGAWPACSSKAFALANLLPE